MPIFDQGYQHWQGTLSGHGWRWLAVARHGVRAQLQNRFVRLLMLAAWLPAIALVGLLAFWGLLEQKSETAVSFLARLLPPEVVANPEQYRAAVWTVAYSYFFKAELICSLFLVLVVGPNLVSRDLRFNALPLYLSRPVRRLDYFLGKLGVIGFFLAATVIVPAVGAYALGVGFSLGLGVVRDTHRLLWAGILYGLVVAVSSGLVVLALSSLSRRSVYVGLAWAGFVFLSHMIGSVMSGINADTERRQVMAEEMNAWVRSNPPPPGVTMVGHYPSSMRYVPARPAGPGVESKQSPEDKAKEDWYRAWSAANQQSFSKAEEARLAAARTDWRPTLSYANNLDRMGDWLLGTDDAWVQLGGTLARPQQMPGVGPLAKGRNVRPQPGEAANERVLADRMVWQFPLYWSAGVLAGLCLMSAFVLSRRVKSLDRLK